MYHSFSRKGAAAQKTVQRPFLSFQAFVHSCGSFAVGIVLCQRVGVVVIALEVGHKEVSVLGFLIGLRLQRCLDGGKAGVRDGACGQADTAVSVVGCKDISGILSQPS